MRRGKRRRGQHANGCGMFFLVLRIFRVILFLFPQRGCSALPGGAVARERRLVVHLERVRAREPQKRSDPVRVQGWSIS